MPHTADYLSFDDSEKLKKLVKLLTEKIRQRKLLFAQKNAINFKMYNSIADEKLPAIIIFIDNYDVIKEIGAEFEEFLNKLTRDGTSIGIYTVITASRSNAVRYVVLNNFKNKIAQFMFDETEVNAIVGRSKYKLPEVKGRALVKLQNVSIMQCYLPVPYENDTDYVKGVGDLIENINSKNSAPCAQGIKMLPEIVNFNEIVKMSQSDNKKIGIGLDTEDVEVQYVDINIPIHLIVGAAQTGKTNMLKLIYKQCTAEKVFIVDSKSYDFLECENDENIVYANSETHIEIFWVKC